MIYLKKLSNLIIKKGKKTLAIKAITGALKGVKQKLPNSKLVSVFDNLVPLVAIRKKKVAGKVYQIPSPIKEDRAIFQAAKWIMLAVEADTSQKTFSYKLGKQLIQISRRKGQAMALKAQFLAQIKENRSYMRFIRKKRKKKRFKYVFKHGYSSDLLKSELESELIKKKKNINKK